MKPFATLGSEISKVRDRVRRGAESLRPAKVAGDVREQRDRLLAKLGEQTFRLIAERKLVVPKMLQESVERLASLLGVQLPVAPGGPHGATPAEPAPSTRGAAVEGGNSVASHPLMGDEEVVEEVDGEVVEGSAIAAPTPPANKASPAAAAPSPKPSPKKAKKNGGKRRGKR